MSDLSIVKLDAISLAVMQRLSLPRSIYLGGLLLHSNGHVYCVHSNVLYVFWGGDLLNTTSVRLPADSLNGRLVQTNGMLVTQDGTYVHT